ncbi:FtsX-like permease family protein [Streptomyces sp. NPDC087294]|uniref:FtsX-like permease family protein n=1 Tax=Streptomyces sp. NPDC087294 TaxID=3365777 RepID=UPI003808B487
MARLGVLNGVVLDTHERIRDLGVSKALGMTPRQTITMVVTSVTPAGLLGGVLGVPIGWALHDAVMPAMGRNAGLKLPDSVIAIYEAPDGNGTADGVRGGGRSGESLPEEEWPQSVMFADGSPVPAAYVTHVQETGLRLAVDVGWNAGDLLLVDNVLVGHGRRPFTGPRRVLVAMSD